MTTCVLKEFLTKDEMLDIEAFYPSFLTYEYKRGYYCCGAGNAIATIKGKWFFISLAHNSEEYPFERFCRNPWDGKDTLEDLVSSLSLELRERCENLIIVAQKECV